jgi:hypothetical protein
VLFLALGVGKAKVDELDLLVFDHFENVCTGRHQNSSSEIVVLAVNDSWKLSAYFCMKHAMHKVT